MLLVPYMPLAGLYFWSSNRAPASIQHNCGIIETDTCTSSAAHHYRQQALKRADLSQANKKRQDKMAALLDATNGPPQSLVGTRIRDDNDFRGTIRYVGPVATSTKDPNATWYGVEWDDNTRGAISASRRVEAPSRRRRASSPGEEVVGGFFLDFEAIRTCVS